MWFALILLNALVLPFSIQGIHSGDSDTFYHLAGGRWMFENGTILDRETFSFTIPDRPWTNYYWLFECLLYGLHSLGGIPAVIGLRMVVMLITVNLLFRHIMKTTQGAIWTSLLFTLLACALYIPRAVNIRPHLFSYLFLVLTIMALDRFKAGRKGILVGLPILCILWANLHGVEYPIALALIALYGLAATGPYLRRQIADLGREWNLLRWPLLLALCAAAFLVNPFGFRLLAAPRIALDQEVMRNISEMTPYAFKSLFYLFPEMELASATFFNFSFWAAVSCLPYWISRRDIVAFGVLSLATTLVFSKIRFMPEFAVLVLPHVAARMASFRPLSYRARALWVASGASTALILSISFVEGAWKGFRSGWFTPVSATWYPIGVSNFMEKHRLGGNVLAPPTPSGYLTWRLYPAVRTAMDMRTPEPFDAGTYWLMRVAGGGVSLEKLAERWSVDWLLVPLGHPLGKSLTEDEKSDYSLVYTDHAFTLFGQRKRLKGELEALILAAINPFDPDLSYIEKDESNEKRAPLQLETKRLIEDWPENHLAHQTRIMLMLVTKEFAAAHEALEGLGRSFPREGIYRYYDGLALIGLKRYEEAAKAMSESLRLSPDFARAMPPLADSLYKTGRYREGLKTMERFFRLRGDGMSGEELTLLGNLRYRAGTLEDAADAYERALWLIEEDSELRPELENNLGGVYLDLGKAERALEWLESALRRKSPYPEAEFNRARAWLEIGMVERAREALTLLKENDGTPDGIRAKADKLLGNLSLH